MKKCFALLAVAIAFGLFAHALTPPAEASGCAVKRAVVTRAVAINHNVQVLDAVAIATFVPVPLFIPSYGATYDNGQLGAVRAELQELKTQNAALQQLLSILKQPAAAPVGSPTPPNPSPAKSAVANHPGLGVMAKNCAACHESAVSKSKGGGITLLSGSTLAALTPDLRLAVVRDVLKGTMPPIGAKLSDDDATQILDLVSQ